eukprot:3134579-Karenia_brevis.AAC.1
MEPVRPGRPTRAWLRKQGMDSDIADETSSEEQGQEETTDEDKKVAELSTKDEPISEDEAAPQADAAPPTAPTSTRVDPEQAAMASSGS